MKKKTLKTLAVSTLALTMIFNTYSINTDASKVNMTLLKKYNTNERILLRNRPLYIPTYVEKQEEEFRGVWVSSVYNLDFPSTVGLSENQYKKEYKELLDNLEELNMNSVIFQVRPKLDAFYKSNINPWSEYLTGKQGTEPGWDPLEWMIEETHNRNMEFHAWFNPYRVTTATEREKSIIEELETLSEKNWARNNQDSVYRFDGKLYLNPGDPKVINYINETIMEVVENYNIDAVHFDDYFYPFKRDSGKWYWEGEEDTYNKYNGGIADIADWRRSNVDKLVETLHKSIRNYNSKTGNAVQFGISPFGIWGHMENSKLVSRGFEGSYTPSTSSSSYEHQFADTRKWVKNNWIDYIAPQIYWTFDTKAAPYGELVHWWADAVKDTNVHLYIGQASYRINDTLNTASSWQNPEEISNQLKFNSKYDEIKGSIFFSYKSLLKSEEGYNTKDKFIDILKEKHFAEKVALPGKPWLSKGQVNRVVDVSVTRVDNGNVIMWEDTVDNPSDYYIIYREGVLGNAEETSKKIIDNVKRNDKGTFYAYFDEEVEKEIKYKYSVVAVDSANNRSEIIYE